MEEPSSVEVSDAVLTDGSVYSVMDDYVKKWSDTLNLSNPNNLPDFLFDVNFDTRDTFILSAGTYKAEYYSLRIEMFKHLTNRDVLVAIATNKSLNDTLLMRSGVEGVNRFSGLTNGHLARMRLLEIDSGVAKLVELQSYNSVNH